MRLIPTIWSTSERKKRRKGEHGNLVERKKDKGWDTSLRSQQWEQG